MLIVLYCVTFISANLYASSINYQQTQTLSAVSGLRPKADFLYQQQGLFSYGSSYWHHQAQCSPQNCRILQFHLNRITDQQQIQLGYIRRFYLHPMLRSIPFFGLAIHSPPIPTLDKTPAAIKPWLLLLQEQAAYVKIADYSQTLFIDNIDHPTLLGAENFPNGSYPVKVHQSNTDLERSEQYYFIAQPLPSQLNHQYSRNLQIGFALDRPRHFRYALPAVSIQSDSLLISFAQDIPWRYGLFNHYSALAHNQLILGLGQHFSWKPFYLRAQALYESTLTSTPHSKITIGAQALLNLSDDFAIAVSSYRQQPLPYSKQPLLLTHLQSQYRYGEWLARMTWNLHTSTHKRYWQAHIQSPKLKRFIHQWSCHAQLGWSQRAHQPGAGFLRISLAKPSPKSLHTLRIYGSDKRQSLSGHFSISPHWKGNIAIKRIHSKKHPSYASSLHAHHLGRLAHTRFAAYYSAGQRQLSSSLHIKSGFLWSSPYLVCAPITSVWRAHIIHIPNDADSRWLWWPSTPLDPSKDSFWIKQRDCKPNHSPDCNDPCSLYPGNIVVDKQYLPSK